MADLLYRLVILNLEIGHWYLFGACLPAAGREFGYWDLTS